VIRLILHLITINNVRVRVKTIISPDQRCAHRSSIQIDRIY